MTRAGTAAQREPRRRAGSPSQSTQLSELQERRPADSPSVCSPKRLARAPLLPLAAGAGLTPREELQLPCVPPCGELRPCPGALAAGGGVSRCSPACTRARTSVAGSAPPAERPSPHSFASGASRLPRLAFPWCAGCLLRPEVWFCLVAWRFGRQHPQGVASRQRVQAAMAERQWGVVLMLLAGGDPGSNLLERPRTCKH